MGTNCRPSRGRSNFVSRSPPSGYQEFYPATNPFHGRLPTYACLVSHLNRHLKRMNHGHLRIQTANGEYIFPVPHPNSVSANEHDDLHAELRVLNNSFWIRLALMSDLGFAEVRPHDPSVSLQRHRHHATFYPYPTFEPK